MATPQIQLDLSQRSMESTKFEAALRQKIVGAERSRAGGGGPLPGVPPGLNSLGRPVGNPLFLGPTGTGKTRAVETTARGAVRRADARRSKSTAPSSSIRTR